MKYYIKHAWCTLTSNRLCSSISITGLALGLACLFVIAKQIQQGLTTDHFHFSFGRIYTMVSQASPEDRPALTGFGTLEGVFGKFAAVEEVANIRAYPQGDVRSQGHLFHADILAVDSSFARIFSFPVIAGDLRVALSDPGNAAITEKLAVQMFGQKYPVGETLEYWGISFKVAAVLKDLPVNSSLYFDLLVPTRPVFYTRMASTWIKLKPGASVVSVHWDSGSEWMQKLYFISLKDLYFDRTIDRGMLPLFRTGNLQMLWILGGIGLAVLLISLFNYMNIYQITLLKRGRGFGVKRVFGGSHAGFMFECWLENMLLVFSSILGAVLLVLGSWSILKHKVGLEWVVDWKFDLGFLLGILLILPLAMSLWPYWKYRKIEPADSLRSDYMGYKSSWMRKGLLVAQYVVTFLMIVVSLYFIRQLNYLLNRETGLNRLNIVQVPFFNDDQYIVENIRGKAFYDYFYQRDNHLKYVEDELKRNPHIQHVCHGDFPTDFWFFRWREPEKDKGFQNLPTLSVAPEFLPLFGFHLKKGRFFNRKEDGDRCKKIVINEAAEKYFKFSGLDRPILEADNWGQYEVIGVVRDFHFEHLAQRVQPLIMVFFEDTDGPALMHIAPGKEKETIAFLNDLFGKVNTESTFSCHFFDDTVRKQYLEDQSTVKIFSVFTLIAIFISTIGLFGFSVFDMRQRYREIALRKVAGASRREVMAYLLRRYYLLIAVSFGIAAPLSWCVIHKYMEYFSEKVAFSFSLYAVAALLTGGVTLITLYHQSFRAASENPVQALRNE